MLYLRKLIFKNRVEFFFTNNFLEFLYLPKLNLNLKVFREAIFEEKYSHFYFNKENVLNCKEKISLKCKKNIH